MLTMGHVLNNTIQDILIRKARMEGKKLLDTGTIMPRLLLNQSSSDLEEKGIDKQIDEAFLNHTGMEEKYNLIIINQLRNLDVLVIGKNVLLWMKLYKLVLSALPNYIVT